MMLPAQPGPHVLRSSAAFLWTIADDQRLHMGEHSQALSTMAPVIISIYYVIDAARTAGMLCFSRVLPSCGPSWM